MESLRAWLAENPRSRPLVLLGFVALLAGLFSGILLVHHRRHARAMIASSDSPSGSSTNSPSQDPPSLTAGQPAEEQIGESPSPPKVAWVREKGAPGRPQPGLDVTPTRNLVAGEEVSWIREDNQWDLIRVSDGTELWVQNKEISLVRQNAPTAKPSGAELVVQSFYQAVARHDYSEAYKYLSPEWKADLDFDHFVRGYDRAEHVRSEIARVVPLGGDRYQVDIKVLAEEFGTKVTYLGFYTVEKRGDAWQMASGELNRTVDAAEPSPDPLAPPSSSSTETDPAAAVPAPAATETPSAGRETLPLPAASATPQASATPAPAETDNPGGGF